MIEALAKLVVGVFKNEKIDYMLGGAYSSGTYAISLGTKDIDIVVSLKSPNKIDGLVARLDSDSEFDRQVTFETNTGSKRYIFKARKNRSIMFELFLVGSEALHTRTISPTQTCFCSNLESGNLDTIGRGYCGIETALGEAKRLSISQRNQCCADSRQT